LLNATAALYVRRHPANHCWLLYVIAKHASNGLGHLQPALLALPRLKSQSKVKQRSSIGMESLDGRFASISAPIVERPCIGRRMADRVYTSLRLAHLLIRTSPRHPCPYSKSQSTPGCSFQQESNISGEQLSAAVKVRFPPKCGCSSPAGAWRLAGAPVRQTNPGGHLAMMVRSRPRCSPS